MNNNELEKRVALRLDTKNKNKTLSKLARRNGENYQDIFTLVNRTLFGDYFMAEFNNAYNNTNPASDKPLIKTRKCVLDYIDSNCLEFYLDCINYIIEEINATDCTIKQALELITPKAKIMLELMHPDKVVLQKSIAYATKKRALELQKGICKSSEVYKQLHSKQIKNHQLSLTNFDIFNDETISEQEISEMDIFQQQRDLNSWKNSKEYKDYMYEEMDRD